MLKHQFTRSIDFKVISGDRIYGLDILRAMAILFVVYGHGFTMLKSLVPFRYYDLFAFDGVSIFFVLSGFLIGQILITLFCKENITKKDILNFWIRRWFRTIPNYFLVLTVLSLVFICLNAIHPWKVIQFYFFSQNLFYNPPDFFMEAWSLSVEEWFYLMIPVLIFAMVSFFSMPNRKSILLAAFLVIFCVITYRFIRTFNYPASTFYEWSISYRMQVASRLDSLMYGVLGAYAYMFYNKIFLDYKKVFFFLGLLILFTLKYLIGFTSYVFYNNVFFFMLESIGTLFLIPFLVSIKKGHGLLFKIITFISIISYSMYLLNDSVIQGLLLPGTFKILGIVESKSSYFLLTKYFLYWSYTLLVSYILFILWERPMTSFRDKIVLNKSKELKLALIKEDKS